MTAIGYVRKEDDGRYKGHLRTVSIQAEIDIVPNQQKSSDSQPDFRVLTQGIEIGAGWQKKAKPPARNMSVSPSPPPNSAPRNSTPIWAVLPGPTKKTSTP
jgi:uncharacterized protein (DUF736 family)